MTSPPEQIEVECPECGVIYEDWYRPSMNLDLDPFDAADIREATTGTCPGCGHVVELDALIVSSGDVWHAPRAT